MKRQGWKSMTFACAILLGAGWTGTAFAQDSAKQQAENEKKVADANAKIESVKQHYNAGMTALNQAKQLRGQMDKLPSDQRASLQGQLDTASSTAITEFQASFDATTEADPNRSILLAKLGDAQETDGKYEPAAGNYAKAVALKPNPTYYNSMGNDLAKLGRIDEAQTAYQKAAELDPPNAGTYWRNFGIVLFNAGHMKDAVDPLRKATTADPKNAQGWYLLGATLLNTMEFKKEGDNLVPVPQPDIADAYQKCIALDPSGPYGAQAKQGLDALQAMGMGISTKVGQSKKSK